MTPGRQALPALAPLRCGDTDTRLAAGFGIGPETACRSVHETVDVLPALAESPPAAMRRAKRPAYSAS
ncbi:helix-turn-helix domain-containing protein [Streptomyces luomodiensis]|uniref:helix-turn-helix domain-containing protein n=1 Tax=Streptomyces luomodiensis TaxID=3026192 RepID=UPI003D77E176